MTTPNPNDPLMRTLRRLRLRLGVQRGLRYLLHGVWIGTTLALTWLVISRLFPMLGDPVPVCTVLAAGALIVAAIAAVVRRPTLLQTALEADRRLELRERLTSSLELEGVEGPMVAAVHADARRQLEECNTKEKFAFTVPRVTRWAAIPVLLFGLAYVFLPEFDLLGQKEREAEARLRDDANAVRVERLQEAIKPLAESAESADGVLAEALRSLEDLAADLSSGFSRHRQALAANNPDLKLAGHQTKTSVARELANALQEGRMDDAARKAAEIMKKLATASGEEKKKLQEDLKSLSESLSKSNSALAQALAKSMNDASTAMQNGDMASAQASLEEMLSSLKDAQSIIDQLNQMDATMEQLAEWQGDELGESEYCRKCGSKKQDGL